MELPLPPSLVYPHSSWDYSERRLRELGVIRSLQALAHAVTKLVLKEKTQRSAEKPPGLGGSWQWVWMGNGETFLASPALLEDPSSARGGKELLQRMSCTGKGGENSFTCSGLGLQLWSFLIPVSQPSPPHLIVTFPLLTGAGCTFSGAFCPEKLKH